MASDELADLAHDVERSTTAGIITSLQVEQTVLEKRLAELGRDYRGTRGVQAPRARPGVDPVTTRIEFETARRDWLVGRFNEYAERHRRAAEAQSKRAAGLDRFVRTPGSRYGLADLTRPAVEERISLQRTVQGQIALARAANSQDEESQHG